MANTKASAATRKKSAAAKNQAQEQAPAAAADAKAPEQGTGKTPSLRDLQEAKMRDRREKIESAKNKVLEQKKLQQERKAKAKAEMEKKARRSMILFVIGLFVMLTALIALFPSTPMIIFSSLLMFSFFFLGIAYQRMVMQLLVVAIACVFITGAFYMIMSSM